jgi:DNA-binding HxlR family transcriptional regulator
MRLKAVELDWDDVSYVISSTYRVAVLRELASGPAVPSRIAAVEECSSTHVSRALQGLREHGLVELLVSEERRKGRVYGATDTGLAVWQKIQFEQLC